MDRQPPPACPGTVGLRDLESPPHQELPEQNRQD
jgi:hypothetical protein